MIPHGRRATLLLLLALPLAAQDQERADLVLKGGRIVTLDEDLPECTALAVRGDRILALGDDAHIAALVGPGTRVIDLAGALAIPGFIEGHGHFLGVGDSRPQLDLMHVSSWAEIVAMVAGAVKEAAPGELIRGRGWHQEKWKRRPEPNVDGLPVHHSLSAVSPDNPVILTHASGHATYANAKAMDMCGISAETHDPEGGEVVRDASGSPIGVFRETASGLLRQARLAARRTDPRRQAILAVEEVLSKGITSFQDAGSSFETIDLFKQMVDEGTLGVRLWVMLRVSNRRLTQRIADYRVQDYGDQRLTVRAIKRAIDGALGSHGAWMLAPYRDLPESSGLNTAPIEDLEETARIAIENGFQLCVHAIGDRGNREVLDLFERVFVAHPDEQDLRWRIEHAQHLHPDDIPRFAGLGVVASMQGVHCTSDGPWVYQRLGQERAASGAYMWRSLMDSGAVVTNGTDAPVEDVDPIQSFYASVSRRLADGSVFFAGQRMSRIEALRSYTIQAAYAAFEEDQKGTLTPGKLADVTVLSKDILRIPQDQIPTAQVLYTIVGGEVAYQAAPDAGSGGEIPGQTPDEWGTPVRGRVVLGGELPRIKPLTIAADQARGCCPEGEYVDEQDRRLLVDEHSRGIANVVVTLTVEGAQAAIPAEPIVLDQVGCRFEPHLVIVPAGATVAFGNSDSIAHNVHTYAFKNEGINLTVPAGGAHRQRYEQAEKVKITCDLHPWMSSYVCVTDATHWALTDPQGSFLMEDVPPGEYRLSLWHETLGRGEGRVEVAENGTSRPVVIEMRRRKGRR